MTKKPRGRKYRSLPWQFVLGSIGGLVIGFYWGRTFDWKAAPDLEAVTAFGTFAAVIVALLPIWQEASRRRMQTHHLHTKLGATLSEIVPNLISWKSYTGLYDQRHSEHLEAADLKKAIGEVARLSRSADLLGIEMYEQLHTIVLELRVLAKRGNEDAERAAALHEKIAATGLLPGSGAGEQ
jgi:hypothetical protein